MESVFRPGLLLRAFQNVSLPRKLGLGERLWGRSLGRRGTTWVDFGGLRWKLNLANDTHRWLVYGEYEEPALRRLLERVLGAESLVVDSGANIGQMILMYLRTERATKIHAFEPTPAARAWLEECLARNRTEQVIVSALALGEHAGRAHLVDHDFSHKEGAQNRISDSSGGLPIEVTTLDAYATEHGIEHIRFWKLDTEGHELPALLGAKELLQHAAIDYLYIETSEAGATITEMLGGSGYAAVPLALDRLLTTAEAASKFTNVFISPRVAREECGLATAR